MFEVAPLSYSKPEREFFSVPMSFVLYWYELRDNRGSCAQYRREDIPSQQLHGRSHCTTFYSKDA